MLSYFSQFRLVDYSLCLVSVSSGGLTPVFGNVSVSSGWLTIVCVLFQSVQLG